MDKEKLNRLLEIFNRYAIDSKLGHKILLHSESKNIAKEILNSLSEKKCLSCDSETKPTFTAEKASGGKVQGYKCTKCGIKHVVEESVY